MTRPSATGVRRQAAPTASVPLVTVEDLRVHFRSKAGVVHAVDGVSFEIRDGEMLGLVGETGCGKSVTARSFLRLVPMPPGIAGGGRILFRPRRTCPSCRGSGCPACRERGRIPESCPACRGEGCLACEGTGQRVVDLTRVAGQQLLDIRGNRISMIFQDPSKALNPALSVREQLAEVFYQHRSEELLAGAGLSSGPTLLRRVATQRARLPERLVVRLPPFRSGYARLRGVVDTLVTEALAETQIPNPRKVMGSYPHELSGGMKQRVMIAQALACDPDLLIADEPTTALDVTIQARILELIRELQERRHTSVLYISHDLSLIRRVCDRVAVMYAGKIVETSTSAELFAEPLHPYTRGLLAAIPSMAQERGRLAAIEGTVPELIDPGPSCRFHTRCPYATELCSNTEPPLREYQPFHQAACFIYEDPEDWPGAALPTFERTGQ